MYEESWSKRKDEKVEKQKQITRLKEVGAQGFGGSFRSRLLNFLFSFLEFLKEVGGFFGGSFLPM